jgi:nitrate reductase NapE component
MTTDHVKVTVSEAHKQLQEEEQKELWRLRYRTACIYACFSVAFVGVVMGTVAIMAIPSSKKH